MREDFVLPPFMVATKRHPADLLSRGCNKISVNRLDSVTGRFRFPPPASTETVFPRDISGGFLLSLWTITINLPIGLV